MSAGSGQGLQKSIEPLVIGVSDTGVIPLGGAIVQQSIYDTLMRGPEQAIEFLHGYTYSGHPIACAAGLATLDVLASENLVGRAAQRPLSLN